MKSLIISTLIAATILFFSGCIEKIECEKKGTTTSGNCQFDRICIDGVEYLKRRGGSHGYMSPHFKPDGTLHTCEER